MKIRSLIWFFSFVLAVPAFAVPAQILIIRHAEKINDDIPTLSETGRKRAEALVDFFLKNPSVNEFGAPVAIFAAAPQDATKSVRSAETVAPLAAKLKLNVNLDFTKADTEKLVKHVLETPAYDGKTVLIAWVRKDLPNLANRFGTKDVPKKWPGKKFDRVWKITFKNGQPEALIDLSQSLLPGDSN